MFPVVTLPTCFFTALVSSTIALYDARLAWGLRFMTSPVYLPCTDGSRLGLGGAPLGNLFEALSDAEARAVVDAAWADGCRTFDTAPHYGHGLSERRLGDALRGHPRSSLRLSSKVGRLLTPQAQVPHEQHSYVNTLPFVQHWDLLASGVRRSVEDSLQRLGLAQLDAVEPVGRIKQSERADIAETLAADVAEARRIETEQPGIDRRRPPPVPRQRTLRLVAPSLDTPGAGRASARAPAPARGPPPRRA